MLQQNNEAIQENEIPIAQKVELLTALDSQIRNNFVLWRQTELEEMTLKQLIKISRSDYYCLEYICGVTY